MGIWLYGLDGQTIWIFPGWNFILSKVIVFYLWITFSTGISPISMWEWCLYKLQRNFITYHSMIFLLWVSWQWSIEFYKSLILTMFLVGCLVGLILIGLKISWGHSYGPNMVEIMHWKWSHGMLAIFLMRRVDQDWLMWCLRVKF
jgi:hypothetical protein